MTDDEFTKGFETACQLDDAKNELARVSAYRGTDPIAIDLQRKQIADAQAEVSRLTEALKPPKPPAPEAAQVAPVVVAPAGVPEPLKPLSRGTAQDAAIHEAMREAGYNPLALPKNNPGKPGVKAAMKIALVGKHPAFPKDGTQFVKAWDRLRSLGEIADAG